MGEFVRVETDQAVATIRLDRPPMNALNAQLQEEIAAAAAEVSADDAVRGRDPLRQARGSSPRARTSRRWRTPATPTMAADSRRLQAAFTAVARIPQAGRGRGHRLCAGRRARAGAVRGLPGGRPGRPGRPAGDPARHHPRRGRDPAAASAGRAGPGQGHRVHRAVRGRRRRRSPSAWWTGSCRTRTSTTRRASWSPGMPPAPRWRCGPPSRRSMTAWRPTWPPAWRSSGCSSRAVRDRGPAHRHAQLHREWAGEGHLRRAVTAAGTSENRQRSARPQPPAATQPPRPEEQPWVTRPHQRAPAGVGHDRAWRNSRSGHGDRSAARGQC